MAKSLARFFLNLSDDTGERQLMHHTVYEVSVDCTIPLANMVTLACQMNQGEFLEDAQSAELQVEKNGQYKALIHLVEFKVEIVGNEEAEEYLRKKNLRVARIEELLALSAQYPELQRTMTIAGRARSAHGDDEPEDPFFITVSIGCDSEGQRVAEVEQLSPEIKFAFGHKLTPYKWACVPVQ